MEPAFRTCTISLTSLAIAGATIAQTTTRVSVGAGGVQGNASSRHAAMSADGRRIAFVSPASNLAAGDANGVEDVYLRDRAHGATELVSVSLGGAAGDGPSAHPACSGDGRFVAFESQASDLVLGDANGTWDVFFRDRLNGVTELVSIDSNEFHAGPRSQHPSISPDGRFVAFDSWAALAPGDSGFLTDVYVRDRLLGTTDLVSVSTAGTGGDDGSYGPSISADGRFVAFESEATDLVIGDTNDTMDIFLRDRLLGTTIRANVRDTNVQTTHSSRKASISADGTCVAFWSSDAGLVTGDGNGEPDFFLRDFQTGTIEIVSVSSTGAQGDLQSIGLAVAALSADGRFVAFTSDATNLVPGDSNATRDTFLRDRLLGTTERASVATGGAEGNAGSHLSPAISADGLAVVFETYASNLVAGDTNGTWDVLLRDRDATEFQSLCEPGQEGVLACPCGNPPAASDRGCDNSSSTGGATLAVAGTADLSADDVVLTTEGEKPTALSIVLQGDAFLLGGVVFGQGVRCVGGELKRLFTKTAVGGSIVAPDFGAGDPSVSARSAAKGDLIGPGESRWYLVYYRDATVLGGCPAGSTFNATPTRMATWAP